jgi:hypothetical protein
MVGLHCEWATPSFKGIDEFTALCFTATGALLAAKRMRILPMTQHA